MMAALPPSALPRLGSLLRLLGSDQDGEALGAARAIGRVLAGFGLTLHDLAAAIERLAAPAEREMSAKPRRERKARAGDVVLDARRARQIADALSRASARGALSGWEEDFVASVVRTLRGRSPSLSARQHEVVERLLTKFGEGTPWA